MVKAEELRLRVNELDLFRFVAALSVVFFHYCFAAYATGRLTQSPNLTLSAVAKYGYLGVELFFMISGFVILMTASSGSFKGFFVSRFVRLYPAFWAACTLTFVVTFWFAKDRPSVTFGEYLVNLSMLSGFFGVPSVDGAYWSLFVELRFYGLVGLVLILGRIRNAQLLMGFWLAGSVFLALYPNHYWDYILITKYSPFFIGGAVCFLIRVNGLSWQRASVFFGSWVLALWHAVVSAGEMRKFYACDFNDYIVSAIVTFCFALMILVSTKRTGILGRLSWVRVGVLTYPLYLVHQEVGFIIIGAVSPPISLGFSVCGAVVLMLLVSHIIHQQVERRYARPLQRRLMGFSNLVGQRLSGWRRMGGDGDA